MHAALQEDGPVVYVDHKRLFPTAGELARDAVPVPIGRAVVRRRGADVTIATHSYMCRVADSAADRLAALGVACEIVDLRTLAPLDVDTVCESAARTGALVTLEEGQLACGIGAEVAYRVREKTGTMRVARVGALPAPVSSNPVLEAASVPGPDEVVEAVRGLLRP
jgi:pyruvate dehydrogenase E1 component beta subunit